MPAREASVQILAADREAGLPVVIGVPFKRGMVRDAASLSLLAPNGETCPMSARPLVKWPDGSVRWGLLTILARETGEHRVAIRRTNRPAATHPQPVQLQHIDDTAVIDNGSVRVTLSATGPGPIRELTALGHSYLNAPEGMRFVVNDADTAREGRRTIEVLEESPLRIRVRVSGAHFDQTGRRLLNYRLDAELWAGWPTLRLDYRFFHLEPGHEELAIRRMAMEWDTGLGAQTRQHFLQTMYSLAYVPREVVNPAPVALLTDEFCAVPHVEDAAMLLDDTKYPSHLRPPLVSTQDWLGVGNGQRSVYMKMQDFMQMRPKRLAARDGKIELEIWPASQPAMKLPQGRSRRQVITMTFCNEAKLGAAQAERLLNAPLHDGRAVITPAWLRACGEFEADRHMEPAASIRFEKYMHRLVNLQTPQTMFDLGDTIDSGYGVTYPPIPNNSVLKRNAPALPRVFLASLHSPLPPWTFPYLYEPIWTNNEYDGLFALCTEIMRTGRPELWNYARWLARHNIEVDFIHYHDDRQQNRATPQHSLDHHMSGSIPSHFWTQGLLQFYCMTGDPDVLEVATALGDKMIEDFTVPEFRKSFWGFTRELGWPTLALAHLVDITGEARFQRQLEEILEFYMSYKTPPDFERYLTPSLWAMSCLFEGTDLYLRCRGRKDVKKWFVGFLNRQRAAVEQWHREGRPLTVMASMVMAIGFEQTGDKRFLRAGLTGVEELIDHDWWSNPPPEIKPMAMTYRGLVRYLHHAAKGGLLKDLELPSMRTKRRAVPRTRPMRNTKPARRVRRRR